MEIQMMASRVEHLPSHCQTERIQHSATRAEVFFSLELGGFYWASERKSTTSNDPPCQCRWGFRKMKSMMAVCGQAQLLSHDGRRCEVGLWGMEVHHEPRLHDRGEHLSLQPK